MNNLYLKTQIMAKSLGYSSDFLLSNRGVIFFEGVHYFTKPRRIDWSVIKMIEWVENRSISPIAHNALQKMGF